MAVTGQIQLAVVALSATGQIQLAGFSPRRWLTRSILAAAPRPRPRTGWSHPDGS